MNKKRVLIISYYWPPSGGSGVQRWLKFVKYFGDFNIQPIVFTPSNPEMMARDESLMSEIPAGTEVIHKSIWEPYSLYKIFTGKKGESVKPGFIGNEGNTSLKERLSLFLRSNIFIPDPKCFWISPSKKYLINYLKDNPVDLIISTGPPHSMHLIAKGVAKQSGIKWIADFRDPWTGMYNFKYLKYTRLVRWIHKRMERSVVSSADMVIVVTNQMAREFAELSPKRLEVVTNGFDEADFGKERGSLDKEFSLTYTGLFFKDRNPSLLWQVLRELSIELDGFGTRLKINLIGNTDPFIVDDIKSNGLERNLYLQGYVPHNEIIEWQRSARVLLLSSGMEPESKAILTGKFFEYIAARRPVLAFGYKDGDIADAVSITKSGEVFEYDEKERLKSWIEERYRLYLSGKDDYTSGDIEIFSRRGLCKRVSDYIFELTK